MEVVPGTKVEIGTQACSLTPPSLSSLFLHTPFGQGIVGYNVVWMQGNSRLGVGMAPWLCKIPLL